MSRVSSAAAYNALREILQGISGEADGYYHDLVGKVYDRHFSPEDADVGPLPYGCMPLVQELPRFEWQNDAVNMRWRLHAYFYVAEMGQLVTEASAVEQTLHLRDDVLRAFLKAGPTLNGAVRDAEILAFDSAAGDDGEDSSYAMLLVIFEVLQKFSAADLGPAAL